MRQSFGQKRHSIAQIGRSVEWYSRVGEDNVIILF